MPALRHLILLLLLLTVVQVHAQQPERSDLISIFRSITPPNGWKPSDSLRIFRGEDLYQLMDGGADIYFEYGFTWAGSRKYVSMAGSEVGLEIYEMRDPEAAYGMFSSLAGVTGSPAPYGQAGVGGDGYVVFQKERFVVSATALDSNAHVAVLNVAGSVDRKIIPGGKKPELVEALLRPNFHNTAVMAFRGPIALEERSQLGLGNIFRVRDGAGGIFDSCRTFVIRYAGTVECDTMEDHVARILTSDGGYRESTTRFGRLFQHSRGTLMHTARSGRYLLVTRGEGRERVLRVAYMLGKVALNQR